jgi:RNA polymerase sigma-70 factor (ECF subfamily)
LSSDEELMSAAAEGDMEAFEELVLRHQDAAVGVAFRLLSDEHEARDAAQEAFLRVLEAAPRYRPTASFRTYLYRILRRICIDHYRRRKPQRHPDISALENRGDQPSEPLEREEKAEAVRRALDALPERQRAALVLQHYEGLSYEDIADVLECSARAVDSLLSRARRSLRDRLRQWL